VSLFPCYLEYGHSAASAVEKKSVVEQKLVDAKADLKSEKKERKHFFG